jgi:hypothetical protein
MANVATGEIVSVSTSVAILVIISVLEWPSDLGREINNFSLPFSWQGVVAKKVR